MTDRIIPYLIIILQGNKFENPSIIEYLTNLCEIEIEIANRFDVDSMQKRSSDNYHTYLSIYKLTIIRNSFNLSPK